jgi:hypothetical protein
MSSDIDISSIIYYYDNMITQDKLEEKLGFQITMFSTSETSEGDWWIGYRLDSGVAVRILDGQIEYWLRRKPTWTHYSDSLDDSIEHCRKYYLDEPHDEAIDWFAMGVTMIPIDEIKMKPRYVMNESINIGKAKTMEMVDLKLFINAHIGTWKEWKQSTFDDLFLFNVINDFETKMLIGATINIANEYSLSEKVRPIVIRCLQKVARFGGSKEVIEDLV